MNYIKSVINLGLSIAKSHFILKHEGTILGVLWYVLVPALTFLFMFGIFRERTGADIPQYPLYLLLGIIIFNFFRRVSSECVGLVKGNAGLINSLNFHHEALVLAIVIKTLFAHIFEILILLPVLLYFKIPLITLLFYPIVLIILIVFTIGAGLILASLGAYFFDLKEMWSFALNAIWFITPIFYSVGMGSKMFLVNLFNPMYFIIRMARDVMIYMKIPEFYVVAGAVGYSLVAFIVGFFLFKKLRVKFSELV